MDIRAAMDRIIAEATAVRDALPPPEPVGRRVRAGENLQAVLDAGGVIELESGAAFEGTFTFRSDTLLRGNGARLVGSTGPAVKLALASQNITIGDITAASQHAEVIELGSGIQTAPDGVPRRIILSTVRIPTHRGKRGIACNATDVDLIDCVIEDVWDPAGRDSQALAILNTPGLVRVRGGSYVAGSECIMVGGDALRVVGAGNRRGILIEDVSMVRPLAWQTSVEKEKVKNGLELKDGVDVTLRRVRIENVWSDAQAEGAAFTFTPSGAGARLDNIAVIDCDLRNVGCGFHVSGWDNNTATPAATTRIRVTRTQVRTNKLQMGGRGIFALLVNGVEAFDVDSSLFIGDGSQIVVVGSTTMPTGPFTMTNTHARVGKYGISANGAHQGDRPPVGQEFTRTLTDNTFTEAEPRFRLNFPLNRYISREEFDRETA